MPERARAVSPLTHLSAASPPHLLVYGEADDLIPPAQGLAFHDRAQELGVACTWRLLAGAGHVDERFWDAERLDLAVDFLAGIRRGPS